MLKKYLSFLLFILSFFFCSIYFLKDYFTKALLSFTSYVNKLSQEKEKQQNIYKVLYNYQQMKINYQKTLFLQEELQKYKKEINNGNTYDHPHLSAEIIGYIKNKNKKVLFINRGKRDNIEKNMIVVDGITILGKVITIFEQYSEVLLLDDEQQTISVVFGKTQLRGIAKGNRTQKDNTMSIIYMYDDKKEEIQIGDLVYASGQGLLYPAGYIVGTVLEIRTINYLEKEIFIQNGFDLSRALTCTVLFEKPASPEILEEIQISNQA